jgi:hypothetical protein
MRYIAVPMRIDYTIGGLTLHHSHRNPSLGLTTKVKFYKGASQKGSPGVTCHVPESVGECEGMKPHTPKRVPTLGIVVPMNSQIFKKCL